MKDIESLLSEHAPKPKRELHGNFTQTIVAELKAEPVKRRGNLWTTVRLLLHKRLALAIVAIALLGTGTAAAITLWPTPKVTPTISKPLPSGNHIVGYDAKNCNLYDELDNKPITPTDDATYYEVRPNAPFTDERLMNSLQAMCEENISNTAIEPIFKSLPDASASTTVYTINAINPFSITVTPDSHYTTSTSLLKPNMTYKNASSVLTYDESTKMSYSDLKVGDSVKLVVHSSLPLDAPGNDTAFNHPDAITVLAIMKVPPLTGNPDILTSAFATYLVRVNPCNTSPTGFCEAYHFAN